LFFILLFTTKPLQRKQVSGGWHTKFTTSPTTTPMTKRILLLFVILSCIGARATAQTFSIKGTVIDGRDNQTLVGVTVVIFKASDTVNKQGTATDIDGNFSLDNVSPGSYTIRANYIGYDATSKTINVLNSNIEAGNLTLKASETALKNVTVEAKQDRSTQSGDTTAFNASAFKTNPDATAEDLINKMPGISTAGGTLKVNGEEVRQVFVDGKPFFGDDPNAAIKNLPSEIIDKIQVFDRASDQSQFTGFDDGNSSKTLNIVTKRGRNNGVFGRVSAGYGAEESGNTGRYTAGGNLNFFNGDRRISLVGLANNINQQNFSSEDLLGVSSSSGGGGRGGFGGNGGRRGGGGGNVGGGGDASNFLVSQQGGITQTQSAGLNYSDNWGKKVKVSGSYFFNRAENTNQTDLTRSYILTSPDSTLTYTEKGLTHSTDVNHRVSMRAEWTIDSMNSVIITPRLSYQSNETDRDLIGLNMLNGNIQQSKTQNKYLANNTGFNFSNSVLYRHRFAKQGRTISVNFDTRVNSKSGDGSLYSLNEYDTTASIIDQRNDLTSSGLTLSGNINYTEPLTRKTQLQLNYNPSINRNNSDRSTYNANGGNYTDLDSNLTNRFDNDYIYHRGGLGYRYSDSMFSINATLNAQYATLTGEQTFPRDLTVRRNFTNLLPQAMLNYRFSRTENIRVFYRTSTNAPSISQLQNIVDNSNPLLLRTGNPDLQQDYTHSMNIRYGKTNSSKGNGIFVFANASYINNYIGNSSTIVTNNETILNGDTLNRGTQISRPVNFEGMWRGSAFLTYSLPMKAIKSNVNFSAGFNYSRTPSIINNQENFAKNYAMNGGVVLGSNISENVDFTVSYNGAYNIAKNSLQGQTDFNYYSQTTSLKFNWIFLKGFVFNTNLNHTLYSGLGAGYDQNFLLWNASLGYKFLKNKALQADIYAFDLLNQNNSITRTITDTYIEDSRTQVLQRYLMLRLTYTIRSFKAGARMPTAEDNQQGSGREHRRPDFSPQPPGGGGFGR